MNILIDIGHPANVHYFRNLAKILKERNHKVYFTTHVKEFEPELLQAYGFSYVLLDKHRKGLLNKVYGVLKKTTKLLFYSIKIRPDIFLSSGSFAAAYTSFLMHKPHITLEDTGNFEQIRPILPFSKVFITPDVLPASLGKKQIRVKSYFEVAALHPKYFMPDKSVLNLLGVVPGEQYCLLRFVGWDATHDMNQAGISYLDKKEIIGYLSQYMKVFISSEKNLPPEFEPLKINIPPHKMHDALYYASLYIGEGATMASEAGLLGTPSIYVNSQFACNNEDQEKFGTVFNFRSSQGVMVKLKEIIEIPDFKNEWRMRSQKLIRNKIDLTAFMLWFLENYPESFSIMKSNPEYQDKFF